MFEQSLSTGGTVRLDQIDPAWAWAAFRPSSQRPWTLAMAGHLFRRAAFGANAAELKSALSDGPSESVDRLMRPKADVAAFDKAFDRDENTVARSGSIESARAWWLRRMIESPFPLQERMTLFWHSHFGVSNARVDDAGMMVHHQQMLRTHALGFYRPLLEAVSQDPAVLTSAGANASRKAQPNENFVRQLMEHFSLGPGNFGEEDVHEASRAFTGLFVLRGRIRYLDREHDPGSKRVLGQQGQWAAQDIVRIVLDQPSTPLLLVRKLYRWFVSETDAPADQLLRPLVRLMGDQHNVGRVVETILRSNLFFSKWAYRRRMKSPVEFALGAIRAMETGVSTIQLASDVGRLGQSLYAPPTVEGWQGGGYWINAVTMLERARFASLLFAAKGPYDGKVDPARIAERYGQTTGHAAGELLVRVLLQDDLPDAVRKSILDDASSKKKEVNAWLRKAAVQLVSAPEFQLG